MWSKLYKNSCLASGEDIYCYFIHITLADSQRLVVLKIVTHCKWAKWTVVNMICGICWHTYTNSKPLLVIKNSTFPEETSLLSSSPRRGLFLRYLSIENNLSQSLSKRAAIGQCTFFLVPNCCMTYHQVFLTYIESKSLKLSFTLNCALKRAND